MVLVLVMEIEEIIEIEEDIMEVEVVEIEEDMEE